MYHDVENNVENWEITLVETGENSATGARIWRARRYLEDCAQFCVTYGDGTANLNIDALISMHKKSGFSGTITGVRPAGRFGEIEVNDNMILEFDEKPNVTTGLINGGFMLFNRQTLYKYFRGGESLILESDVLKEMVKNRQLGVYKHEGYWQCVDTLREYNILNNLWAQNKAPWKIW